MTTMYAARMARLDLLRAIGHLARKLTQWIGLEDKKLRKIIEYIHSSYDLRLTGFVGDEPEQLSLVQYSGADYASDRADAKFHQWYISGASGADGILPLAAHSRRQAAVSRSTAKAEEVAAEAAMREIGVRCGNEAIRR